MFDYIERFYNPKRNHTTIGYISPMTFEGRDMKAWIAILETAIRPPADLAIDLEWRQDNPGTLIKPLKTSGNGLHTKTEEEIAQIYKRHSLGTLAHPAITLMPCTGAARTAAVMLGKGNMSNGRINCKRQKPRTTAA